MLTVTAAQWEALQADAHARFAQRLRARLARRPEPVGTAALRLDEAWFATFVDRCRGWGLTDQADVFRLAELALFVGRAGFERGEVRAVLEDAERDPELKMFQVRRRLMGAPRG